MGREEGRRSRAEKGKMGLLKNGRDRGVCDAGAFNLDHFKPSELRVF